MINKTRTYFIRSANRRRILATLAMKCIEYNRLAVAIAIASPHDHSPSRKNGREEAFKRLDQVLGNWKAGFKVLPRMDHLEIANRSVGAVCEVNEIVPFLTKLMFENVVTAAPRWLLKSEPYALDALYEYTDLFAKIRNDVEKASCPKG